MRKKHCPGLLCALYLKGDGTTHKLKAEKAAWGTSIRADSPPLSQEARQVVLNDKTRQLLLMGQSQRANSGTALRSVIFLFMVFVCISVQ